MISIGDKVKILSVGGFNERFVKVGDIAEICDIHSDGFIELSCDNWDYAQYALDFEIGEDWEIVTPSQVIEERRK